MHWTFSSSGRHLPQNSESHRHNKFINAAGAKANVHMTHWSLQLPADPCHCYSLFACSRRHHCCFVWGPLLSCPHSALGSEPCFLSLQALNNGRIYSFWQTSGLLQERGSLLGLLVCTSCCRSCCDPGDFDVSREPTADRAESLLLIGQLCF